MTDQQATQPWPAPTGPHYDPQGRKKLQILGYSLSIVAIVVVVIGMVLVGGGDAESDDDGNRDTSRRLTLTEAACQVLSGHDAEFAYSVIKDLAADHPLAFGEDESIAARAAVEQAQAQGCGG